MHKPTCKCVICANGGGVEGRNVFHTKVWQDIERVGWSVLGVCDKPPFIYSIGMTVTLNSPEILIAGFGLELGWILNCTGEYMRKSGHRFSDGEKSDEILEGLTVEFMNIPKCIQETWLGQASMFPTFSSQLMLLPDKRNLLPTDPECDHHIRSRQLPTISTILAHQLSCDVCKGLAEQPTQH